MSESRFKILPCKGPHTGSIVYFTDIDFAYMPDGGDPEALYNSWVLGRGKKPMNSLKKDNLNSQANLPSPSSSGRHVPQEVPASGEDSHTDPDTVAKSVSTDQQDADGSNSTSVVKVAAAPHRLEHNDPDDSYEDEFMNTAQQDADEDQFGPTAEVEVDLDESGPTAEVEMATPHRLKHRNRVTLSPLPPLTPNILALLRNEPPPSDESCTGHLTSFGNQIEVERDGSIPSCPEPGCYGQFTAEHLSGPTHKRTTIHNYQIDSKNWKTASATRHKDLMFHCNAKGCEEHFRAKDEAQAHFRLLPMEGHSSKFVRPSQSVRL
ncbi:hypothetical protein DFH08DRAFT_799790 [Mycena albidolilacea]|uniref:Uncharacterized protein n=1 Tax=Mycena albidolilacea TaxID=1033008 RepID=A0AAD7AMH1_9AGAR|nr:hypothetical protein DFH08DRAFT_799790 [Mycena albidolilacea]